MIARYLETAGMPTVIMGCARDIVEHVGVARFWCSDFPLGHSAGKPHDPDSQAHTLNGALAMFDAVQTPRTTHLSTQTWAQDETWQDDFMDVSKLDAGELDKLKQDHENARAIKADKATRLD